MFGIAATTILSRLTLEGDTSEKRGPTWAPDGRSLFYTSTEAGRAMLLRRAADGTGASEKLGEESTAQMMPTSVSPDGQFVVYSAQEPDYNVKALPLSGNHTPTPLVATPKMETNGEVSPCRCQATRGRNSRPAGRRNCSA